MIEIETALEHLQPICPKCGRMLLIPNGIKTTTTAIRVRCECGTWVLATFCRLQQLPDWTPENR